MGGLFCSNCNKEIPYECQCDPKIASRVTVKNDDAFQKSASRLKVMARARPEDKHLLVAGLVNMGKIVAVLVNDPSDIPCLRIASAGIAMGSSDEICLDAASIITLRDSFADIANIVTHEKRD